MDAPLKFSYSGNNNAPAHSLAFCPFSIRYLSLGIGELVGFGVGRWQFRPSFCLSTHDISERASNFFLALAGETLEKRQTLE